jgi:hypothetical protein
MAAAPTMAEIARGQGGTASGATSATQGSSYPSGSDRSGRRVDAGDLRVESPSSRFVEYRQRSDFFEMQIPSNWHAYEADNGFGVTIVPNGGVVDTGNGQQSVVYGVIVNHYDPFEGSSSARNVSLGQATSDLVNQIRRTNPHLAVVSRAQRSNVDGQAGLSTVLSGTSPVTRQEERVTVFTRQMGDGHVIYMLMIAPGRDYAGMNPAFSRMVESLRVNDQVAHADQPR